MKWNIGKKGGATYFFARSEGGATEFFAKFEGGATRFFAENLTKSSTPPHPHPYLMNGPLFPITLYTEWFYISVLKY